MDLELYYRLYLLVLDGPKERHLFWDRVLSPRQVRTVLALRGSPAGAKGARAALPGTFVINRVLGTES